MLNMTSNGGESTIVSCHVNRYLGICKILLKYKPNINLKTSVGIGSSCWPYALHAEPGSPKLRQIFIKHGGEMIQFLNVQEQTPLELTTKNTNERD